MKYICRLFGLISAGLIISGLFLFLAACQPSIGNNMINSLTITNTNQLIVTNTLTNVAIVTNTALTYVKTVVTNLTFLTNISTNQTTNIIALTNVTTNQTTNLFIQVLTNTNNFSISNYITNSVTNSITNYNVTNITNLSFQTNFATNFLTNVSLSTNVLTNFATNTSFLTNFTPINITNTVDVVIEVSQMQSILGEWLVTMVAFDTTTNGWDSNGNIISIPIVQTNFVPSIYTNGAGSYVFKADGTVDANTYNDNGIVVSCVTDAYQFGIYSNQYGQYIELVDPSSISATYYTTPQGLTIYTDNSYNLIVTETNYENNYTITNIFDVTNASYQILYQTNNLVSTVESDESLESFQFTIVSNNSTMLWAPDSVFTNSLSMCPARKKPGASRTIVRKKSYASETVTMNSGTNGSISKSTYIDFTYDPDNYWVLQKISTNY
jgi:hypothetical protein